MAILMKIGTDGNNIYYISSKGKMKGEIIYNRITKEVSIVVIMHESSKEEENKIIEWARQLSGNGSIGYIIY